MAQIHPPTIDHVYHSVDPITLTPSGPTAILQGSTEPGDGRRPVAERRGDRMRKGKGRLTTPLVRDDEVLRTATWAEALDRTAAAFARARDAGAATSFGIFSCSKASNEMNFLAQKFARQVMGTNNIDSCNRT
jgi:formate dehydrogenase (hydrogenase)